MRRISLAIVLVVMLAFVFALPVGAFEGHTSCAQIVRLAVADGFVAAGPNGEGLSGAAVSGAATSGPGALAGAVAEAQSLYCTPTP